MFSAFRLLSSSTSWCGLTIAVLAIIAGCDLPRDPERTFDRVRGGTLRVGISVNQPWTAWEGDAPQGRPSGIEPELIEDFAKELGSNIEWVHGSETELLTALENYDLDLVAAGLKDDTLWSDRVGLSRPYAKTEEGKHVLATPPGENEFLLRLDKFLAEQETALKPRIEREKTVNEIVTED